MNLIFNPSGDLVKLIPPKPLITILTDFGTSDAYVASMKGVILSLNPQAVLVDISHEVPPQDILAGALILAAAAPYFPPGTIHLAVVDPGVGGPRRALAAFCNGHFWVGPDNGLFHLIFRQSPSRIVSLENNAYFHPPISATFHGRDIFAPVAAHLSLGIDFNSFGPPVSDPVSLDWPEPTIDRKTMRGEIIYIDRFGNLVSNIRATELLTWLNNQGACIKIGSLKLSGLPRTYSDASPGEFLALIGSHGFIEIACSRDNAARRLNAAIGLEVEAIK